MKKFTKILISTIASLGIGVCAFAAIPEKVEIKFAVGDETLLINGTSTTVQKPYVVGDGVTLVPLRVITEAFGAEVEWIGETQQIKLSYPDVNITLQIGNTIAEVNGIPETLLSAPELKNDTTMVPLRFISETFGADVAYDPATMGISVIKETKDISSGTVIDKVITESKIGDSYYGWTMEKPSEFDMTHRSFDGSSMLFEANEDNYFSIQILAKDEDYNFERDFIDTKNLLSGLTLIKADKNTEMLIKSMNFQAKDSEKFMNILIFEADKYILALEGFFKNDNESLKNEGIRLMETFTCSFSQADTHNLSEVVDGIRPFSSDKLKLSFNVPQNYYMTSSETVENRFSFASSDLDDTASGIIAEVYSKSSVTSAEVLANKDYIANKEYSNPSISSFTAVKPVEYQNFNGFEYTYKINGSAKNDSYHKDVFFEAGDYVYNIHISQKSALEENKANKILNSVKATAPDFNEIGILMRNDADYDGTFTHKTEKWSMSLPNSYSKITENSFLSLRNLSTIYVNVEDASGLNITDIQRDMEIDVKEAQKQMDVKVKVSPGPTRIAGNQTYMTYTLVSDTDGSYFRELSIIIAKKKITFTMIIPEQFYSDRTLMELNQIVASYRNEY